MCAVCTEERFFSSLIRLWFVSFFLFYHSPNKLNKTNQSRKIWAHRIYVVVQPPTITRGIAIIEFHRLDSVPQKLLAALDEHKHTLHASHTPCFRLPKKKKTKNRSDNVCCTMPEKCIFSAAPT